MSQWPKMTNKGTVTIDADGVVTAEGFEFENASCREACQLAMAWAIEKLGAALVEDMTADAPVLSGIG